MICVKTKMTIINKIHTTTSIISRVSNFLGFLAIAGFSTASMVDILFAVGGFSSFLKGGLCRPDHLVSCFFLEIVIFVRQCMDCL